MQTEHTCFFFFVKKKGTVVPTCNAVTFLKTQANKQTQNEPKNENPLKVTKHAHKKNKQKEQKKNIEDILKKRGTIVHCETGLGEMGMDCATGPEFKSTLLYMVWTRGRLLKVTTSLHFKQPSYRAV